MRLYSESIYYALTFFMCMCALVCGSQTITLSVILRMLSAYAETQCLIGVELTN